MQKAGTRFMSHEHRGGDVSGEAISGGQAAVPLFNGVSTVEMLSSLQASAMDFKASQSVLDDMTEISVANENEDAAMRQLKL